MCISLKKKRKKKRKSKSHTHFPRLYGTLVFCNNGFKATYTHDVGLYHYYHSRVGAQLCDENRPIISMKISTQPTYKVA